VNTKRLYYFILTEIFISLLLPSFIVHAMGDSAAGKTKAQACAACHGADGNSTTPIWPKLAGQHAEYIVKQLQDFKSGKRSNEQMSPLAANLE
jgi:Cytochrome c553